MVYDEDENKREYEGVYVQIISTYIQFCIVSYLKVV